MIFVKKNFQTNNYINHQECLLKSEESKTLRVLNRRNKKKYNNQNNCNNERYSREFWNLPVSKKKQSDYNLNFTCWRFAYTCYHKNTGTSAFCVPAEVQIMRILHDMQKNGFCDKNGFPLHILNLLNKEPCLIIDFYNRNLMQIGIKCFVNECPRFCEKAVSILRYSCMKTLARKYTISVHKINKRFGLNLQNQTKNTLRFLIYVTKNKIHYEKECNLLTYAEIYSKITSLPFYETRKH